MFKQGLLSYENNDCFSSKVNDKANFYVFPDHEKWLSKLAYLADIYQHLKHLEHEHAGHKSKQSTFHRKTS
jgi:hypothetical protein